ncbi:MAG: hypothetical protein EBU90_14250 [Proteobacteria bacterium]|nr:hypothetical protein [Pseudomonadota bacterium]NBP14255.1 hypothetical protein [bacterium]
MTEIISQLNPNQRFWIVIRFAIIISLVESVAQSSVKSGKWWIGVVGYAVIVYLLYDAYNYEGLGHMNLVWSCVSIIVCYAIGFLVFNEPFNRYTFAAVVSALCAIYLAHRSDEM